MNIFCGSTQSHLQRPKENLILQGHRSTGEDQPMIWMKHPQTLSRRDQDRRRLYSMILLGLCVDEYYDVRVYGNGDYEG